MSVQNSYVLKMNNITKSFNGMKVINNVTLSVKKGEVHVLMGENGAGKSTLMKILAGVYKPDEGEIIFKGKPMVFQSPSDALKNGISMIHQELSFIPGMTVAQNVFLGREVCYKGTGVVNQKKLNRMTAELFAQVGLRIRLDTPVSSLSVSELQMVEIVKAISYDSDLIVMDEPTSAITEKEVEKLFQIIKMLTQQGKSIIYISHKMKEIYEVADRITVLRDGSYIATNNASELTQQKLISQMVGRELSDLYQRNQRTVGSVLMQVKNLNRESVLHSINFTLHKGEILGIAGLVGAGRTELAETLFGYRPPDSGEIYIHQKHIDIRSPKDAIKQGVALVTEDRKQQGLNLAASVRDNMTLSNLKEYVIARQIVNRKKEREVTERQIRALNIRTSSQEKWVNYLSGGNQQKVVLAKWLLTNPEILILDEPTRGVDIGAKFEIYDIISNLANEGKAIILISSEMPELIALSDRIITMYQGKFTAEFSSNEFDQEQILACCTGHEKGVLAP